MKKIVDRTWRDLPEKHSSAFTLIELLAVMAIIVLLAALVLGVANHANYKSSLSKAQTEITAFASAIEAYKVDNGIVPHDPGSGGASDSVTDALDPQKDFDPGANSKYRESSRFLYRALSGFAPGANGTYANQAPTKPYFNFQPTQLEIFPGGTATVKSSLSPDMYIVDPFGLSYGYSTAAQTAYNAAYSKDPPDPLPTGIGYNPTYDLWSTAGYSRTGGKPTPSKNSGSTDQLFYSNLWIKNW